MGWRWMTDGSAQYQEGRISTRFNVERLEESHRPNFFIFNMYNIVPKALIQGVYLVRRTCTESTKVLLVMANTPSRHHILPHRLCKFSMPNALQHQQNSACRVPAPNPHHTTHPSALPSPPEPPLHPDKGYIWTIHSPK